MTSLMGWWCHRSKSSPQTQIKLKILLIMLFGLSVCCNDDDDDRRQQRRQILTTPKYISQNHGKSPLYKINYVCSKPEILDVYILMEHSLDTNVHRAKRFCKCFTRKYKMYRRNKIKNKLSLQYSMISCNNLFLDLFDAYLLYALHHFDNNEQNKRLGIILK